MNLTVSQSHLCTFFASPYKALQVRVMPSSRINRRLFTVTMRDRSKNRRALQRGRNLSIEAIQTIQALKRAAKRDHQLLEQVFNSNFRRLLKFDMMAVLNDLLRQNECALALKVFEDVRKELWYKPRVLLYADMIEVFARNDLFGEVELLYKYFKTESNLEPELKGFNALLQSLISFDLFGHVMECYNMMKGVGCDPDRSSFRILINGLESKGEKVLSAILRKEAQSYYGESLEFLLEEEMMKARKQRRIPEYCMQSDASNLSKSSLGHLEVLSREIAPATIIGRQPEIGRAEISGSEGDRGASLAAPQNVVYTSQFKASTTSASSVEQHCAETSTV